MQFEATKETELFFRQYLRAPKRVGSVAPSSKYLARALASELDVRPGHHIIELGGGTGSITMGLLDRGVPRDQLIVLELDPDLHAYLQQRFHGVRVINGDATRLDEILADEGVENVSGLVCGIPMLGMSVDFQRAIYDQAFKALPEGGSVFQYGYSPFPSVKAKALGLVAERRRCIAMNLPPAFIWRYARRVEG